MTKQTGPEIDRSIYLMPMFANLTVEDLAASQSSSNALGLITLATIPGKDGTVQLVHLRRMRNQAILITAGILGGEGTAITLAAGGENLGTLAERAKALPGAVVAGPVDSPWLTMNVTSCDPDGNQITIATPRLAEQADAMKSVQRNISGEFETPASSLDPTQ